MDEAPYAGDYQEHHGGELIDLKREVELERAHRQPAPEIDDDRCVRRMEPELHEDTQGHDEGPDENAYPDVGDQVLGPRSSKRQCPVDQEAGERQRDGEPDE